MDRYRKQSIRSNRFIPKDNLDRLTIILAHNSIIESKACQSSFNRNVCLTRLKNSAKGDSTKIVPAHKQVQQHIVQLGETQNLSNLQCPKKVIQGNQGISKIQNGIQRAQFAPVDNAKLPFSLERRVTEADQHFPTEGIFGDKQNINNGQFYKKTYEIQSRITQSRGQQRKELRHGTEIEQKQFSRRPTRSFVIRKKHNDKVVLSKGENSQEYSTGEPQMMSRCEQGKRAVSLSHPLKRKEAKQAQTCRGSFEQVKHISTQEKTLVDKLSGIIYPQDFFNRRVSMETNIDANALKKLVDKKLGTEEDEDNSKYNCFEKLMKKVKRVSQKMEEKKNQERQAQTDETVQEVPKEMQGSKNERLRSKSNTGGASREEVNKGYGGCKTRKIPWGPPKCEETRGQAKVMMQNNYFMEDLVKEETTIVGHISSIGFNATDDKELSAIKTVPAPLQSLQELYSELSRQVFLNNFEEVQSKNSILL